MIGGDRLNYKSDDKDDAVAQDRSAEVYDPQKRGQTFSHRTREINKLFMQGFAKDLRAYDITIGQWQFLRALWERDGYYQQELSSLLNMTSAAAVFSINLLERDGLAIRRSDPKDSRRYLVHLTAKGYALRHKLMPLAKKLQLEAVAGFSAEEILQLSDLLSRMKKNLEQAIVRRDPDRQRSNGKKSSKEQSRGKKRSTRQSSARKRAKRRA